MPDTIIQSPDAESALVGFVLKWPEEFTGIDIEPEDFYDHRHRDIWRAFIALANAQRSIDELTVCNQLQAMGKLEEAGGMGYLVNLIGCVPFGHNPEGSAAIIRDKARRRALVRLASDMVKAAYNDGSDLEMESGRYINALAEGGQVKTGAVHWKKYLTDAFDEITERAANPSDFWGIQTGFADFDRITGGLQNGECMLLSGKPGVGKTMLATQMAAKMAEKGSPGAIYSLEMDGKAVVQRVLSAYSKVSSRRMKSGRLNDGDWPKIGDAMGKLASLPIYLSDYPGWTTTGLRADLTRLKATAGIQWFMFDYLLLAGDGKDQKEWERTGMISRAMKLICRQLDMPGIIIHSMDKEGLKNGDVPGQNNLRGSAQVAFDADLICFLTEFIPVSTNDQFIKPNESANMRTVFFGKGRNLEDPQKYFHLVKLEGLPLFGDYASKK